MTCYFEFWILEGINKNARFLEKKKLKFNPRSLYGLGVSTFDFPTGTRVFIFAYFRKIGNIINIGVGTTRVD